MMSQDQQPLPADWELTKVGAVVVDIQPGFASGKHNSDGEGLPHLRPMNVSTAGKIDRTVTKFVEPNLADRSDRRLRPGDVLFNNTNSIDLVGKTAYFVDDDSPAFSNHMTRLRVDHDKVAPEYLARYLHACWSAGQFAQLANNHVSQASVGRKTLSGLQLPLPPLEQQRQIVALFDQVDQGQGEVAGYLVRAQGLLAGFRQAVLAAACSGQLTVEWRRGNHPESSASALLRKRAADRSRLGRKYKEPVLQSPDALPPIPDEWCWAALPELGELGRGKSKHRPRNHPSLFGGEYPFIQTGDVARSGGLIISHSQTYNDVGLAQSRLWPAQTVCITIAANIADTALLTYPACFPDSVVGLIADEAIALPEYVELFMRTARRDLAAFAPATAQANINLAILSKVAVALPPLEEQREIIRRANEMFRGGEEVLAKVSAASSLLERTSKAALAKAFRGELVETAELAEQ
ncbi:restriction endonuclease subunit S [Amycolatopsis sp. NPDC057786]|uniref:restriction endonuclease subunit S n=1 Tax=Amycolatopsis sp. NPDC057786 TaxID=3346250 RepID=UPI00366C5C64